MRIAQSPVPVGPPKSPFLNLKFAITPYVTDKRKFNNVTPMGPQSRSIVLSPMREVESME